MEVATGGTKTMLLDSVSRATESSHRLLLQAAWQGNIEVIQRLLVSIRRQSHEMYCECQTLVI